MSGMIVSTLRAALVVTTGFLACSTAQAAEGRIQQVVSPGGIVAWLVQEPAIPMIAVEIGFDGGARLDEDGKEGAANLAAGLIEEGAGPYDSQGFSARRDDLSTRITFETGRDGFYVGMRTLTENAQDSFDLLRIALADPTFAEADVDRVREQVLSSLRSDTTDPQSIAGRVWYGEMLAGTPYARRANGTLDSVAALTREDIVDVYGRMVATSRMNIGVVGDIGPEDLAALLDATFTGLPEGEPLDEPTLPIRETGGKIVIEENVPQSTVVFGHSGILRDDPDFIPAYVMNYVLGGGGLTSRLTDEVREKNGLAYSVYSYLNPLDQAGLYMGGVATANARVEQSLDLIRQEWARMAEGGLTEAELESAKRYLTGAFALRFDSNAKIARYLVSAQESGLGIDYIDTRNALVEAVTLEDIARIAKRLLRPDDMFFVVVGKPEGMDDAERRPAPQG